jgi:muramoyltetrapeptide carboxypeptidase
LQPGATIGVLSPASPVEPERLERGMDALRARGYRVIAAPHVLDARHHLAGDDADRAADFNALWADAEIDALWCSRGGYGTMRLLEHLDWDLVAARPKPFLGYSDVTALQLALFARTGLVTFSAPMVGSLHGFARPDGMLPATEADLWRWLRPEAGPMPLVNPGRAPLVALRPGRAAGRLLGGNLTLVTALVGTPWLPALDGAILAIEDVGEKPYTVDRMLTHLALAGVLDRLAAIVLGDFSRCWPEGRGPALEELVLGIVGARPVAVIGGLLHGHIDARVTLPLGAWVELDGDPPRLVVHPGR